MMNFKSTIDFGVVGLGRFGFALAETLSDKGKEVLVLDNNESKIKQIQDKVQQAFVIAEMDKPALEETGIQNCETVIVCIGENIEASILTTLNVIELGVNRVIAKAISAEHGKVLSKIGAEVVYPEKDRAVRLARSLSTLRAIDYIDLSNRYAISEIKLTDKLYGKTIVDLNIRKKFGLNIIAVIRKSETIVDITPDLQLIIDDLIVVIGSKDSIIRFEQFLTS